MADVKADDLWIFGYGSLMWKPGFDYAEAHRGILLGYGRSFCVYSTHHRGTHERPGLVLGLDRGGACAGMAFRVRDRDRDIVLAYLRAREQINGVYRETHVPVQLLTGEGREVFAVAYVVERAHPSYAGRLGLRAQARLIRAAQGASGPNVDYLINTLRHAEMLGFGAPDLRRLLALVGPVFARDAASDRNRRPGSAALVQLAASQPVLAPRIPRDKRRRFIFRINRERTRL